MRTYYYLPIGAFYAFSVKAKSMVDARAFIRGILGKKTLHGVQVWRA